MLIKRELKYAWVLSYDDYDGCFMLDCNGCEDCNGDGITFFQSDLDEMVEEANLKKWKRGNSTQQTKGEMSTPIKTVPKDEIR